MSCKPKSPEDVLRTIKDHKIQIIDLRFTDLAGLRKYFSVPSSAFNFESFEGGVRCDAFSIHQGDHAPALLAICESAPNSYHHLAPCFDAPISRDYSQRSRPGVFRVPYPLDSRGMRIEFRCPGPLCNPYITFAAMLMAGIDGFQKRLYDLDPSEPIENFHYLPPQAEIPSAPDRPEADYAFLSKGDVFPPDVINSLFYNAP